MVCFGCTSRGAGLVDGVGVAACCYGMLVAGRGKCDGFAEGAYPSLLPCDSLSLVFGMVLPPWNGG